MDMKEQDGLTVIYTSNTMMEEEVSSNKWLGEH